MQKKKRRQTGCRQEELERHVDAAAEAAGLEEQVPDYPARTTTEPQEPRRFTTQKTSRDENPLHNDALAYPTQLQILIFDELSEEKEARTWFRQRHQEYQHHQRGERL